MVLRADAFLVLPLAMLAMLAACPLPAGVVTCEEEDACGSSTQPASSDEGTPTTGGDGTGTETNASSTAPDGESGVDSVDTLESTGEPAGPPLIVEGVVIPDYIDDNGVLAVEVSTANDVKGVRMLLDTGAPIELTPAGPDKFVGEIAAFTGIDNDKHLAVLTPWRAQIEGESVVFDYVIALPQQGSESSFEIDGPGGRVAAIALLPDERPVEFGTYQDMGASRCYLHLRDKHGASVEFMNVLPLAECRAIDLKIDRDSGQLYVLVEREKGNDTVWWAGEAPAWGKAPDNIGTGAVGDTAFALAAGPDVVAVCGSRAVPTTDKLDALAVLLRAGKQAEERLFDYRPDGDKHLFRETARDCAFAGETLVLVGEAHGQHDEGIQDLRDRHMVIEFTASHEPLWTVAGIELGIHTRALALDFDEQGRYHLVGDKCSGVCEPEGELWTYESGGALVDHGSLGPLGTSWFGPHDIAWSPAGYAVVAYGQMQGESPEFRVKAFAPGDPVSLWTFFPNTQQGLQLAVAVAVGPYGEVYAGGLAVDDQPAFKRIGS